MDFAFHARFGEDTDSSTTCRLDSNGGWSVLFRHDASFRQKSTLDILIVSVLQKNVAGLYVSSSDRRTRPPLTLLSPSPRPCSAGLSGRRTPQTASDGHRNPISYAIAGMPAVLPPVVRADELRSTAAQRRARRRLSARRCRVTAAVCHRPLLSAPLAPSTAPHTGAGNPPGRVHAPHTERGPPPGPESRDQAEAAAVPSVVADLHRHEAPRQHAQSSAARRRCGPSPIGLVPPRHRRRPQIVP